MTVPESKRHTRRLVLRVSPDVAAWVREQALAEGVGISDWVARVVNRIRVGTSEQVEVQDG